MRIGVLILPEHRWADARHRWEQAEALGFAHAWTYDHIAWSTLRDGPWFSAVPTLTAAAMVTSKIRLGTLVASPNFRHPVPFARELISLDDVSGGRVTLGIGAGGLGWDATVLGQAAWSRGERSARFDEFMTLLDQLLRDPETTFAGTYYSAERAPMHPGCVQRPRIPFAIAASGPRTMRTAARLADMWVTNGDQRYQGAPLAPAEGAAMVRAQLDQFARACDAEGRDPTTIGKLVSTGARLDAGLTSRDTFRRTCDAYEAIGITDLVVHWPRPDEPYKGDPRVLEEIAPGA